MSRDFYLPPILRMFLIACVALVAFCLGIEAVCYLVLHWHFPFNFPVLNTGSTTGDLLMLRPRFEHLHHLEFFDPSIYFPFIYPAPMAIPYAFFLFVPKLARPLFYSFCLLVVGVTGTMLARSLVRRGIRPKGAIGFLAITFLCSYPLWFELKQGNMEIVVVALLALGVWAFLHDRGWSAATCFGIAGSMKLFPFILVGLLLARRQYLKSAYALFVAVALTVASLWMIFPSIGWTWAQINNSVADFRNSYLLRFDYPQRQIQTFDHSLWAFLKAFLPHTLTPAQLAPVLTCYIATLAAIGIGLYIWRIRLLPVTNQVLCLIVASILFTPVSFDYTLMHLYIPWALLVLLAVDSMQLGYAVTGLNLVFGCLVLLCSPITELIYHGTTLEGRIKTITLVVLLVAGLRFPFSLPDKQGNEIQNFVPDNKTEPNEGWWASTARSYFAGE